MMLKGCLETVKGKWFYIIRERPSDAPNSNFWYIIMSVICYMYNLYISAYFYASIYLVVHHDHLEPSFPFPPF